MNNYINIFLEFLYLLCNAFLLFRICEENMHNKISIPMKLFYIIVFVVFPATIHAIGILSYFAPILFMLIIFRKLNKLLLKCLFNYNIPITVDTRISVVPTFRTPSPFVSLFINTPLSNTFFLDTLFQM